MRRLYLSPLRPVLHELLAGSISCLAKNFAVDQYRLNSSLQGHSYYKKTNSSRIKLTEADLRRALLVSRQAFNTKFQELLLSTNKLADIVPMSTDSVAGVLHQVYLKAYDAECNAAARHAVACVAGAGVRRRRT